MIRQNGQELWYNWRINFTQTTKPDELPEDMVKQVRYGLLEGFMHCYTVRPDAHMPLWHVMQASSMKNVRWYNPRTKEFSWEDPKFQTPWRELQGEGELHAGYAMPHARSNTLPANITKLCCSHWYLL